MNTILALVLLLIWVIMTKSDYAVPIWCLGVFLWKICEELERIGKKEKEKP